MTWLPAPRRAASPAATPTTSSSASTRRWPRCCRTRRAVRRLLVELAHGSPLTTLDASTAPVLDALVAAGLVVAADEVAPRDSTTAPAAGSTSTRPTASSRRCCGWSARPASGSPGSTAEAVGGAGLERGRAAARAARRLDARRARRTWWSARARRPAARAVRRPGRHRLPALRRRPPRRARPAAGAGGRAGRHDATAAAAASPTRRCARWPSPGRCATSPPCAEGGLPGHLVGHGRPRAALPPTVTTYRRHLHCGCAWADDLVDLRRADCSGLLGRAERHQYSLSSLPSIARRCSREQLSQ